MNETLRTVLMVVILLLVGYSIFVSSDIKTDVKGYYTKIDSLQVTIDSAMIANAMIDEKINRLDANIMNITNEIMAVDQRINDIKIQTNGKVTNVDRYSHAELTKFFTKRYNTSNR